MVFHSNRIHKVKSYVHFSDKQIKRKSELNIKRKNIKRDQIVKSSIFIDLTVPCFIIKDYDKNQSWQINQIVSHHLTVGNRIFFVKRSDMCDNNQYNIRKQLVELRKMSISVKEVFGC